MRSLETTVSTNRESNREKNENLIERIIITLYVYPIRYHSPVKLKIRVYLKFINSFESITIRFHRALINILLNKYKSES